jgi:hypothetical protein
LAHFSVVPAARAASTSSAIDMSASRIPSASNAVSDWLIEPIDQG